MPTSEYTNKCNKRSLAVCKKWKHKKRTHGNQKKKKSRKSKRKRVSSSNIYIVAGRI